MKIILTIFAFIPFAFCSGQALPEEFSIRIKATTSTPANEFIINIAKQNDNLKLVYGLRDSVSYRLNLDKKYNALNDLVIASFATASRDSLVKLGAKQDSFRSVYSFYSKDSISVPVSDVNSYIELLKKINKTGNMELTNSSANAARNQREGPLFEFRIISPKESRVVYAQYPTASTNPLLYQLITESLKLYRDKKQNNFLDKKRTNGY